MIKSFRVVYRTFFFLLKYFCVRYRRRSNVKSNEEYKKILSRARVDETWEHPLTSHNILFFIGLTYTHSLSHTYTCAAHITNTHVRTHTLTNFSTPSPPSLSLFYVFYFIWICVSSRLMDGNIAANGKFWNVREINIKKLCYSPQQQQRKKTFRNFVHRKMFISRNFGPISRKETFAMWNIWK